MMKVKTSSLTSKALDYLVAVCDDRKITFALGGSLQVRGRLESGEDIPQEVFMEEDLWYFWNPSSEWVQGGPIIERESITIIPARNGGKYYWVAENGPQEAYESFGPQGDRYGNAFHIDGTHSGDTPLIAAMRCYVASKLGDVVDVPDELMVSS
jgi:hypothetical protein